MSWPDSGRCSRSAGSSAKWYTFIRHGTELDTAYTDTLGDLTLGSLGGAIAAVLVVRQARRETKRPLKTRV